MRGGWQPIETAPRDGTAVLLVGGDLSKVFSGIAPHPKVGRWMETDKGMAWVLHYSRLFISVAVGPTYWHPIPVAPLDSAIFAPEPPVS